MTSAEARAAFDAALEGLAAEEQRAFDAALASDPELRAEFERHRALFGAGFAREEVQVDLLAGVQHKLRARSGGRFYRDRFAERSHQLNPLLLVSVVIVIVVALWFAYQLL